MSRFAVPARIVVDADSAIDATTKADYLAIATRRLGGRGYSLQVTGLPFELSPADQDPALCEHCGDRQHDGEPCPNQAGAR